MGELRYSSKHS